MLRKHLGDSQYPTARPKRDSSFDAGIGGNAVIELTQAGDRNSTLAFRKSLKRGAKFSCRIRPGSHLAEIEDRCAGR